MNPKEIKYESCHDVSLGQAGSRPQNSRSCSLERGISGVVSTSKDPKHPS
jgi:hypothetical protein